MKNSKIATGQTDVVTNNPKNESEYLMKFYGYLMLISRCDAAYLKHHQEPYSGPLCTAGSQSSYYSRKFSKIKNKPDWLITLTFDTSSWPEVNERMLERAYDRFQLYLTSFMLKFPAAWICWGVDFNSSASTLSFRLVGSLCEKRSNAQKNWLKNEWLEVAGGEEVSAFEATLKDVSIQGCLFSPGLKAMEKSFSKMFPGRKMYGVEGEKNMKSAPTTKAVKISAHMKGMIEQYIWERGRISLNLGAKWLPYHSKKEFYQLTFLPKEIVDGIKALTKPYRI